MSAKVLLVRLSSLGDVVCCLPAAVLLRRARPDVEIHWLVEDRFAPIVAGVEEVDCTHVFPRSRLRGAAAAWRLIGHLRSLRRLGPFDEVVDLHASAKSSMQVALLRAQRRIGPARGAAREGAHFTYGTKVDLPRRQHRWERAAWLVAPLLEQAGFSLPASAPRPTFAPHREAAARAEEELGRLGPPRILLHAGTSSFARFKRWPAERFGLLARSLAAVLGTPCGLLFGPGEETLAECAARAAEGAILPLAPSGGLPLLVERLRRADLVVGSDSGPLLLASALGARTVALFGPKDPAVYAPPFEGTHVVRRPPPCAPCSLRQCGDPVCMTGIQVEDVLHAAVGALGAAGRAHAESPRS